MRENGLGAEGGAPACGGMESVAGTRLVSPHRQVFYHLLAGIAIWCMAAGYALGAPQCASYQDGEEEIMIAIVSPSRLEIRTRNQPPRFYHYRQNGDSLEAVNLSNPYDRETLRRSTDGEILAGLYGGDSQRFPRVASLVCQADEAFSSDPEARACWENLPDCQDTLREKSVAQLETLCDARLPFACLDLLKRSQEASAEKSGAEEKKEEPPPVCREGEATYDEAACGERIQELIGKALAKGLADAFQSLYADPVILPKAMLERLSALCQANVSAELCAKAAEHLWDAGEYPRALEVFARACQMPIGDPEACRRAGALESLSGANLTPAALETLPCGHYAALNERGLMPEFDFGDRGKTRMGELFLARARLENGLVRIRHDKGGDFVLRALSDGTLVGQDSWNRYAIYQRTGGETRCAAPVAYRETQLEMDCRAGEDMESCCARGGMQGCNGMGHQSALQGDWQAALPFYAKMCQAGIRSGCENMVTAFAEGGVEKARETLETICAEDAQHVACDIVETTGWELFDALQELRKISQTLNEMLELEEGDGEDVKTDLPDEEEEK